MGYVFRWRPHVNVAAVGSPPLNGPKKYGVRSHFQNLVERIKNTARSRCEDRRIASSFEMTATQRRDLMAWNVIRSVYFNWN